jgi:hypothetical protein
MAMTLLDACRISNSGYTGVTNFENNITSSIRRDSSANYGDSTSLSTLYDGRMRPTRWDVSNVLGYDYNYDYFMSIRAE